MNLRPTVFGIAIFLVPSLLLAAPGDAVNGKRLFVQIGCYQCHGYVGQGGASGPRIAPWALGPEALISYVRRPVGHMPPYTKKVMPDNDLTDIWAYLKSIPTPKSAKDIPQLSDAHSK